MSTSFRSLLCATALLVAATPAKAQLWYNGNWNGSTTILSSERDNWVLDSRVYDNFLVPEAGWTVNSLFGDFLSSLTPTVAYWEIRSGVSAGNGGTLLFSGQSAINWAVLGEGAFGYNQYRATVTGLDFVLSSGTYWMAIAPVQSANGRAFINSTSGTNGVNPLQDGNSYWDSKTFVRNFEPTSVTFGTSADFAYGVGGSLNEGSILDDDPVLANPEPATMALLATGLGLLGLSTLRRRRRVVPD